MATITDTEFMHPFKRAPQKDQVQAALYYDKHFGGDEHFTASEIRALLARARIPGIKGHNITRSLTRSVPNVHQADKRGAWEITGTGEISRSSRGHRTASVSPSSWRLRGSLSAWATKRRIEAGLQARNPRAKFKKKADFEDVKDSDLIQIAQLRSAPVGIPDVRHKVGTARSVPDSPGWSHRRRARQGRAFGLRFAHR